MSARLGFPFMYALLITVLAVAAFAAGVAGPWKTTQTIHVTTRARVSGLTSAQLVAALGKPDAQVAGATVNSQLAALTCDQWIARRLLICF